MLLQDGCFGMCMSEHICSRTKKRQYEWYWSTVERDRSAFSAERPCALTCTVGQLKVGWAGVSWQWLMIVCGRVSSWET